MSVCNILIVEDEKAIRDMLLFSLPRREFYCEEAESVQEAEQKIAEQQPDIVLLDWMLPDKSGTDFLKWLRKHPQFSDVPVIMLTAKAEEKNKVAAFEIGADDYVVKPFSPKELMQRIKAILRRSKPRVSQHLAIGEFFVDFNKETILYNQAALNLTANEYKLLLFFLENPEKIFSREQLLMQVVGYDKDIDDRAVDAQIKRLRQRLKPFAADQFLQTKRGHGYWFTLEESVDG